MKINFTKEHFSKMKELAIKMLLANGSINTKMGQVLNIQELLHCTTINTLNDIRLSLQKKIEAQENKDEWVESIASQQYTVKLKEHKELINLIIGYKRYNMELEESKLKKATIEAELNALKESQKTPEDKIKELEEQLNDITTEELD